MAKFFTLYDQNPPKDGIVFDAPSLTDQTFKDECDIHHIIDNFGQTGIVDSVGARDPATLQYGDTTLLPDYETACNLVANVTAEFGELPSKVRAEFNNDPRFLLEALGSTEPSVVARLEELGLKQKVTNNSQPASPQSTTTPPNEPQSTSSNS